MNSIKEKDTGKSVQSSNTLFFVLAEPQCLRFTHVVEKAASKSLTENKQTKRAPEFSQGPCFCVSLRP